MSSKIPRGARVTVDQIECLLDFIHKNRVLLSGKTHPLYVNEVNVLWSELTNLLNSIKGPKKTLEEWKRFFIEFKSKTKKKARDISTNIKCTGGGGKPKKLNDIEERLMTLVGWVTVVGNNDLPSEQSISDAPENLTEDQPQPADSIDYHQVSFDSNLDQPVDELLQMNSRIINSDGTVEEILIEINDDNQECTDEQLQNHQQTRKGMSRGVPIRRKMEKPKAYTSSVNLLKQSAKIYAESSDQLSSAINNFAQSVNALSESIKIYAEVVRDKNFNFPL